jgi:hypothetical protein
VKQLVALAFLPADDIPGAFHLLKTELNMNHELDNSTVIYYYFEEVYINGRPIIGGKGRPPRITRRRPPRYPPTLWSVNELLEGGYSRSNNSLEAWHRRFEILVGRPHLGVFQTIDALRKEDHRVRMELAREASGHKVGKAASRDAKAREARIQTLMNSYGKRNTVDLLRGLSHNLRLNPRNQQQEEEDETDNVLRNPMFP